MCRKPFHGPADLSEQTSPHHPDTERRGGEGGGGGGGWEGGMCEVGRGVVGDVGVVRSASDHQVTNKLSTLSETDGKYCVPLYNPS